MDRITLLTRRLAAARRTHDTQTILQLKAALVAARAPVEAKAKAALTAYRARVADETTNQKKL